MRYFIKRKFEDLTHWIFEQKTVLLVVAVMMPVCIFMFLIHSTLSSLSDQLSVEIGIVRFEIKNNSKSIAKMETRIAEMEKLLKKELNLVRSEEYLKARDYIRRYAPRRVNNYQVHVMASSFVESSRKHGVDLGLALGLGRRESQFIPNALSTTNDHGVMQVNERYWGSTADMSIQENIDLGVWILSNYIEMFDEEYSGVSTYNMGPSRTKRGIIRVSYVNDIMKNRSVFRSA